MHITFAPKGILQIDDARITYRNFTGAASQYNRKGDKNFALIIDDEDLARALIEDKNEFGIGWNIKQRPPREEGDSPLYYLPVKIRFNDSGPNVYLKSGDNMVRLDEDSISCLDSTSIEKVDLDIRPYDDKISGKPFRAAYLQGMCVTQRVRLDRFSRPFDNGGFDPDDVPF